MAPASEKVVNDLVLISLAGAAGSFHCLGMCSGFALSLATDQEVQLASSAGTEQILFAVDPAAEDVSHALSTVNVGGETGYVLTRGPTGSGLYAEAVVVRHHAAQYEVSCTGFRGYDRSRLEQGCAAFIGSLRFVR